MSDSHSEIRHDPVRGHTTIIAPQRGKRPNATRADSSNTPQDSTNDPFLLGNEHLTTEELFSIWEDDDSWSVRVVKNRYPALLPDATANTPSSGAVAGHGQHEVIIECPHFETELANLSVDKIAKVLSAWQARLNAIKEEGRFDYGLIFKNSGHAAGASLPHSHSQLIAIPEPFSPIQIELERARQFYLQQKQSLLQQTIETERDRGLVVLQESELTAWCPFASRFSSEVWIAGPKQAFQTLPEDELATLASMLHRLLNAIRTVHSNAAYNMMLHATPFSSMDEPWFDWRLEICPRLANLAGFELATGCYINSIRPEIATQALRAAIGHED